MRGEPNSVACQFASKPSAETLEFERQRVAAEARATARASGPSRASSLPANCTVNDAGAAQADADLNCTRVLPASGGASGAFASTSAAPLAGVLLAQRLEARHPLLLGAVDRDVVGRAQPGEARRRAERDRRLVPDETAILVGDEVAQARFGRHDEGAAACRPWRRRRSRWNRPRWRSCGLSVGGEVEPRRRDLDVLARPVAGLVRDHERRAVEVLLRSPVAGELLPHAVLARSRAPRSGWR